MDATFDSHSGDATSLALILDTSACSVPPTERWLNTVLVDFTWAFSGLSGGGGALRAFVVDPAHNERVPQALRSTLSVPVHCARRWEGVASLPAWRSAPVDLVVALRLPRHFGPGHYVHDAGLCGRLAASLFGERGMAEYVRQLDDVSGRDCASRRCVIVDMPSSVAIVGPTAARGHEEWGVASVAELYGSDACGAPSVADKDRERSSASNDGDAWWTNVQRAVRPLAAFYMTVPILRVFLHAIMAVLALVGSDFKYGSPVSPCGEMAHSADAVVYVFAPGALASVGAMSRCGNGTASKMWRGARGLLGRLLSLTRPLRALAYAAGIVDTWPYPGGRAPTAGTPEPAVAAHVPAVHAVHSGAGLVRAAGAGRRDAQHKFIHTLRASDSGSSSSSSSSSEERVLLTLKAVYMIGMLALLWTFASPASVTFVAPVSALLLVDALIMIRILLGGKWIVLRPARHNAPPAGRVEHVVRTLSRGAGWALRNVALAALVALHVNGGHLIVRAATRVLGGTARAGAANAAADATAEAARGGE